MQKVANGFPAPDEWRRPAKSGNFSAQVPGQNAPGVLGITRLEDGHIRGEKPQVGEARNGGPRLKKEYLVSYPFWFKGNCHGFHRFETDPHLRFGVEGMSFGPSHVPAAESSASWRPSRKAPRRRRPRPQTEKHKGKNSEQGKQNPTETQLNSRRNNKKVDEEN